MINILQYQIIFILHYYHSLGYKYKSCPAQTQSPSLRVWCCVYNHLTRYALVIWDASATEMDDVVIGGGHKYKYEYDVRGWWRVDDDWVMIVILLFVEDY